MTADCRDDKDQQLRKQNAVGNKLIRKFSFAPTKAKITLYSLNHIIKQFIDVLFGITHTLLENLLSVIVTHSNDFLMFPDTPARVWHLL